jgi:hypothetical protein
MDFPNLKGVWGNLSYLTNGDAAVDLSRSELQNTRFCAGRGVLAGLSGWPTATAELCAPPISPPIVRPETSRACMGFGSAV